MEVCYRTSTGRTQKKNQTRVWHERMSERWHAVTVDGILQIGVRFCAFSSCSVSSFSTKNAITSIVCLASLCLCMCVLVLGLRVFLLSFLTLVCRRQQLWIGKRYGFLPRRFCRITGDLCAVAACFLFSTIFYNQITRLAMLVRAEWCFIFLRPFLWCIRSIVVCSECIQCTRISHKNP